MISFRIVIAFAAAALFTVKAAPAIKNVDHSGNLSNPFPFKFQVIKWDNSYSY